MQYHVRGAEVRVPLGGWPNGEETDQVQCAQVHRLPDDMGAGSAGRRNAVPVKDWRSLSEKLHSNCENDSEATVPGVRPHLSSALFRGSSAERRGPLEHVVQAFYLFCTGVQSH